MSDEHNIRTIIVPDNYKPTLKHKLINLLESLDSPLYYSTKEDNMEDYLKLPYFKRHKWGFWYLTPAFNFETCRNNDAYFKKQYPIQYFIRKKILSNLTYRSITQWWYTNVSSRINPRQKWLMDGVPNTWSDKVWLIPHINFKMVVHFIEAEKCFEYTDYENSGELHVKFASELKECYKYIKIDRPSLEKQVENAYPNDELKNMTYEERYAEVNRLEKLIEENDTKWLTWIVINRNFLWT